MNPSFVFTLLAAALSVFAQSYTTVDVYEECTNTIEGTDTITSTIIETTCPLCTGMSQTQIGQYTHTTVVYSPPLPTNTMSDQPPSGPLVAPNGPPSGQLMGGGTTITTTICPGSTSCHHETRVTEPTTSLSMMAPSTAAAPVATVFASFLGGVLAAAGAILM
jgi:hypothetical protein